VAVERLPVEFVGAPLARGGIGMAQRRSERAQDIIWRIEGLAYDVASGFLRLLPIDWASAMGGAVLRVFGPLTSVQKTVDRNLRIAFPDMSPVERRRISRAQWEETGRMFAEFPLMDRVTPLTGRVEVVGAEHLEEAVRERIPTIFFSGHLSNYEVMAAVVVQAGIKGPLTYRAINNPYVDKRVIEGRRRYGVELFAAKGVENARELYKALVKRDSIGIMVDQKFNFGVSVPFFGHRAPTNPGPVRLALQAKARIQPLSVMRLKGARFRMILHEPYYLERTGDRTADVMAGVQRITDFIEERARERPEEYFWVHKRWGDEVYEALGD
jgi:KDO2-lipid IV(A) lauroyltransferase